MVFVVGGGVAGATTMLVGVVMAARVMMAVVVLVVVVVGMVVDGGAVLVRIAEQQPVAFAVRFHQNDAERVDFHGSVLLCASYVCLM